MLTHSPCHLVNFQSAIHSAPFTYGLGCYQTKTVAGVNNWLDIIILWTLPFELTNNQLNPIQKIQVPSILI